MHPLIRVCSISPTSNNYQDYVVAVIAEGLQNKNMETSPSLQEGALKVNK